jgi:hypothetical protein
MGEDSDYFEGIERWIEMHWERLQYEEQFRPQRGPSCWRFGGCPVLLAGECPEWSEKEVERLKNGKALADTVRVARITAHQRAQAVEEVKSYLSEEKTVLVDDMSVGYESKVSYKYRLGPLLEFCAKNGVDLSGLTLSKTDVERAIRKQKKDLLYNEDDVAALETCRVETATKKFNI